MTRVAAKAGSHSDGSISAKEALARTAELEGNHQPSDCASSLRPQRSATILIKNKPVTNSGKLTTESVSSEMRISGSLFSNKPAITPSASESGTDSSRATSASRAELMLRSMIRSRLTAPRKAIVSPHSPRKKSRAQLRYCAGSEAFKPSSSRISAICSSVASRPPAMTRAGSPGRMRSRKKIVSELIR